MRWKRPWLNSSSPSASPSSRHDRARRRAAVGHVDDGDLLATGGAVELAGVELHSAAPERRLGRGDRSVRCRADDDSGGHRHDARQLLQVGGSRSAHRIGHGIGLRSHLVGLAGVEADGGDVGARRREPSSLRLASQIVGRATRVITLASTKRPRSRWSSLRSAGPCSVGGIRRPEDEILARTRERRP